MKRSKSRGQALTEFALVFPIFVAFLFGIIVYGLGVFYQQQVENVAREGARYAAIHSATAQCPTVSNFDPALVQQKFSYYRCDEPATTWPKMTAFARNSVWGIDPGQVRVSACWSSYYDGTGNRDAPPTDPSGAPYTFQRCTYAKVEDDPTPLSCPAAATTVSDDMGSAMPGNQVSVYACMVWRPPMAGFLMIPTQVTMRSVITEVVQKQQS